MSIKRILAASALFGALACTSNAQAFNYRDLHPYAGLEYKFQATYPKNPWVLMTPRVWHHSGMFLGSKFFKYVGLELGYSRSGEEEHGHTFGLDNHTEHASNESIPTFFGVPLTGLTTANHLEVQGKVRMKGWNLDLNAYLPVSDTFDLMVTLGYVFAKPRVDIAVLSGTGTNLDAPIQTVRGKNKTLPRVGFGGEWSTPVSKHNIRLGLRGRILWENTYRARIDTGTMVNTFAEVTDTMFRDSFTATFGGFVRL